MTAWLAVLAGIGLQAQNPSDALMMEAKQGCILLDYNFASFDQYWEGELKRNNETIATVERQSVMPMVAVGILDDLNFYLGVPYIRTNSTEPNGGKFQGVDGFQDLIVALKYRWLNKKLGEGHITGLATVGFSTPVTNYLSDYMPYSIGFGAPEMSYRLIFQYNTDSNWYIRTAGAYLWRGYTKAEREYYYNNGSYFTEWMDVPDAITTEAILGKWLFNKSLQVEVSYWRQQSLSGDDIRPYNAAQPTIKVNSGRIGATAHYYFEKLKGLGIIAYHTRVVNGRNAPVFNTTGVGLTYFFNYLKTNQ